MLLNSQVAAQVYDPKAGTYTAGMTCVRLFAFGLFVPLTIFPASRWMTFEATAYSVRGQTANGQHTVEGRTVAADPQVLPLGTRVQIREAGPYSGDYTVQDDGQKINGRKIDIFLADAAEAKKFGNRTVRVRILRKPRPAP